MAQERADPWALEWATGVYGRELEDEGFQLVMGVPPKTLDGFWKRGNPMN